MILPTTNRAGPPGGTGSASISGPHMAAQCRLPSSPSTKAIPKSILFSGDGDFLFEEIILFAGVPFDAHTPEPGGKLGNIQRLRAVGFQRQRKVTVQLWRGRAVKLHRPGKFERTGVRQ